MKRGFLHVLTAVGLIALVAAFAVSVGTSSAPAGGVPEAQMTSLMAKVTNGGNAPYTATFEHLGKSQTHVRYHNPIPGEQPDGPVYASCDGTLTATEFVCDPIKLTKGEVATVTIVWKALEVSSDCEGSEPCMVNESFWSTDAGTNAPLKPKKIASAAAETGLLDSDDSEEAATYALGGCDPEDLETATLATNQDLDENNPLATIVCIPGFLPPNPIQPGLVGTVLERGRTGTDHPNAVSDVSEVCLAVTPCGTAFTFGTRITFLFLIDEDAFDFPEPIDIDSSPVTQVFHDGDPVPSCVLTPTADPCYESIESDGDGTTTVLATGTENGGWDFG